MISSCGMYVTPHVIDSYYMYPLMAVKGISRPWSGGLGIDKIEIRPPVAIPLCNRENTLGVTHGISEYIHPIRLSGLHFGNMRVSEKYRKTLRIKLS